MKFSDSYWWNDFRGIFTSYSNNQRVTMMKTSHAWVNLVKAMAGVGVFALPVAFQQAGLWVGTILTFILGVANAHCMIKLVKCSQYLCHEKNTLASKWHSSLSSSKVTSDKDDLKLKTTESKEKALQNTRSGDGNIRIESMEPLLSKTAQSQETPYNSGANNSDSTQHDSLKATQGSMEKFEIDETVPREKTDRITLDYGNTAEQAFASRQSWLRRFAMPAKYSVNFCLVLLQLGICSVFYIFVSEHIKEVVDFLFGTDFSIKFIFLAMLPCFILLTSVQNLSVMSCISLVGNVLVTTAIAIVLVQLARMPHIPLSDLAGVTTIPDAASAAGSITYAYAAQAVVLPLENQMRNPRRMIGFFGVISTAVAFVGVLYTAMAILGYITYGSAIEGSITLNLTNSPIDFSVKVMLLLMTYCGYLIQHYPIFQMIWPTMERRLEGSHQCLSHTANYTFRYITVIMSFFFAYTIPNLEEIIPIIGVTTGMLLAFVFPALLESVTFWEKWRKCGFFTLFFNITINTVYILTGLLFLVIGVHTNVTSMTQSKHV